MRPPRPSPLAFAALIGVLSLLVSVRPSLAEPSPIAWETALEVGGYYDSDHVAVLSPALTAQAREPSGGWSANGSYLVDIVSAASVDIVSTASPRWTEVRHAGTLGVGWEQGGRGGELHGATSVEPDFVSLAVGGSGKYALDRKNATLSLGYGYEHDVAGRTGTPFSVYSLELDRHRLSGAVELVMDRATTLTPSLDVMLESGRQEKPYRFLPLFEASVADGVPVGASPELVNELRLPGRIAERLPDTRQRYAGALRLAHRFERSTLVLWERAYLDSWGLLASTADARWVVELHRRWSIWPRARFHTQSGASFWRRAYVGSIGSAEVVVPEYRSGDRELGPLWSAALGSGVGWDLGAGDPRRMSLALEGQGIYTEFRDALYIDHRWAAFGVASFALRFR